jgi:uncharacterized protein
MNSMDALTSRYGKFVGEHAFMTLLLVVAITLLAQYGNSLLESVVEDNKDMIPDKYPEIRALNDIGNEFGGMETGMIVIEINPKTLGSDEIRDVRDPRIVEYALLLAKKVQQMDYVMEATSLADLISEGEHIPRTERVIKSRLAANPRTRAYVSNDYTMTLVRMDFRDSFEHPQAYDDIQAVIDSTPAPAGTITNQNGEYAISTVIGRDMGPDMARTSQFSLIGVLIIVVFMFWSLRHGLTSLTAIAFGVIWTFGLMGLLGMQVTNVTTGGASMIMGIGIDFGIQVTSRFRIEKKRLKDIAASMSETIRAVYAPMGTTTLAALIGFRAMSMGELKVLSDLADMMSLGVLCCMMAAITVVPALLVLGDKFFDGINWSIYKR